MGSDGDFKILTQGNDHLAGGILLEKGVGLTENTGQADVDNPLGTDFKSVPP
jgi:hypothetical protein